LGAEGENELLGKNSWVPLPASAVLVTPARAERSHAAGEGDVCQRVSAIEEEGGADLRRDLGVWRRRRRRVGPRGTGTGLGVGRGGQGLTLVHFSAQLEPCLTQENIPYTLNTL
jgi:hypothetical protein